MEFDREKLAENDGKDGKPAYVAAEGKVFDVTASRMWKNGLHMNRHQAGEDLTEALSAAPHGAEVLQRYKEIGELKAEETAEDKPPVWGWILKILDTIPFLIRHPHPMVVHFPMAFFIVSSLFLGWYYLINPVQGLLDSIFYMHILGTVSLPAAIATGWLSWLVNYYGKSNKLIIQKIILSMVVLIFDIIVLVAMLKNPAILKQPQGADWAIAAMIFAYLPIVSIIGANGGMLVFPVHKKK